MSVTYNGMLVVSGKVSNGTGESEGSPEGGFTEELISDTYSISTNVVEKMENGWSGNALTSPSDGSSVGSLDVDLVTTATVVSRTDLFLIGMASSNAVDDIYLSVSPRGFGVYIQPSAVRYDNCSIESGDPFVAGSATGDYLIRWVASEQLLYVDHPGGSTVLKPTSNFFNTVEGLPVHIGFTLYATEETITTPE